MDGGKVFQLQSEVQRMSNLTLLIASAGRDWRSQANNTQVSRIEPQAMLSPELAALSNLTFVCFAPGSPQSWVRKTQTTNVIAQGGQNDVKRRLY